MTRRRLSSWHPPLGRRPDGKRRKPAAENGTATWHRSRLWVMDRAKGRCEARIRGICHIRADHVHHIVLRSRGGSDDPSNLLAVCHACHDHIHANPAWATENGFMRPLRKETP